MAARRTPIAENAPNWFEIRREEANSLEGLARVPTTRWAKNGLSLRVEGIKPVVRETVPGTELPTWCLERHIFNEADFCIGLVRAPIRTRFMAERWWGELGQYVVCQSVASETGLWPLMNGLDHGNAGLLHYRALDLATRLEILDEYLSIHAGYAPGFSAETIARLGHLPDFHLLRQTELERRAATINNDIDAAASSRRCCGTMRDCPFRKSPGARLLPEPAALKSLASLLTSTSALIY